MIKNKQERERERERIEKESESAMEMKVQGRVRCIKNGDMATNPGIPFHRGFVIDPLNFSLPLSSVMFSLAHFLFSLSFLVLLFMSMSFSHFSLSSQVFSCFFTADYLYMQIFAFSSFRKWTRKICYCIITLRISYSLWFYQRRYQSLFNHLSYLLKTKKGRE